MNLKQLTTKLENATVDEVSIILNDKAMTVGANATVDYIGLALENLESQEERIKTAIAELREVSKAIKEQKETIKVGVSAWLTDNGIEKLQGDRISSISIYDKKETIELVIDNEESVINAGYFKMVIDETSVKKALSEGINIDGAHLEITHNEPSIRLNKKRLKDENNSN